MLCVFLGLRDYYEPLLWAEPVFAKNTKALVDAIWATCKTSKDQSQGIAYI